MRLDSQPGHDCSAKQRLAEEQELESAPFRRVLRIGRPAQQQEGGEPACRRGKHQRQCRTEQCRGDEGDKSQKRGERSDGSDEHGADGGTSYPVAAQRRQVRDISLAPTIRPMP